jgi:tetratricopeptide (TPR) repeat protein
VTRRRGIDRLLGWLRREARELEIAAAPEPPAQEPEVLASQEERWLAELAAAAGEGERGGEIGGAEFYKRIEALHDRGDERLAAEWLEKFIEVPLTPSEVVIELRVRLVEMLDLQSALGRALPHLHALVDVQEHAVRAHYLLGEHYRRRGDALAALRHYEAVLAQDVDYPNVRVRVERLRSRRGGVDPGGLGETIVGPEAGGAGAGTRYRLIRELGRGATAVVYLARDGELQRDVAIKLLHPHISGAASADRCAQFFAEARIAASLRHPNIMAILDLDERARRIVLELAAGGTLRTVLRERGPRPLRRALERHAQVLSALQAAHRRGVVHRDLKPANLMFRRDPDEPGAEVVLGDFGVAHLPGTEIATAEKAGAVGTLAYMAPEQRRADEVDPRWDLYAAAVVLFEMLTGRHPWPREVLLAGRRSRGDFALPAEVVGPASGELVTALQDHLDALGDPDSEGRPETATALEAARVLRDLAIAESAAL